MAGSRIRFNQTPGIAFPHIDENRTTLRLFMKVVLNGLRGYQWKGNTARCEILCIVISQ